MPNALKTKWEGKWPCGFEMNCDATPIFYKYVDYYVQRKEKKEKNSKNESQIKYDYK